MSEKPITVLLVEDNPGDVSVIRQLLRTEEEQFKIKHVTKLSECLTRLRGDGIDIVLLDLGLPDSSGLATLTSVRKHAPGTPIIVITGLAEKDVAVRALKHGAQDFIAKELVDAQVLIKAVRRCAALGPSDEPDT